MRIDRKFASRGLTLTLCVAAALAATRGAAARPIPVAGAPGKTAVKLRTFSVTALSSQKLFIHGERAVSKSVLDCDARVASCTRVIESNPIDANAYCKRAEALYLAARSGNYCKYLPTLKQAESDWTCAIRHGTNWQDAHYRRAIIRNQLRNFAGARQDLDADIESNPDSADSYYLRALLQKENLDLKIVDLKKAVSLAPDRLDCLSSLALWQDYRAHDLDALKTYDLLVTKDPSGFAYGQRGQIKLSLNDCKGAIADFDRAIDMGRDCLASRAKAKASIGDHFGALQDQWPLIWLNMRQQWVESVDRLARFISGFMSVLSGSSRLHT